MNSLHHSSNYFFSQAPNRFGGKQDEYLHAASNLVTIIKEKLQHATEQHLDITELFKHLLKELGAARNSIAQNHQPEKAEFFGQTRSAAKPIQTGLFDVYQDYQDRLLSTLQPHIQVLFAEDKNNFFVELGVHHTIESRMEVRRLEKVKITEWASPVTMAYFNYICRLIDYVPETEPLCPEQGFNALLDSTELMSKIREKSLNEYNRIRLSFATHEIETTLQKMAPSFQTNISDWVLFTLYNVTKCDDGSEIIQPLSEYLTFVERSSPRVRQFGGYLNAMNYRSVVYIQHQSSNEAAMAELAYLFEQAVKWDGADQQQLINLMAEMNYKWAHAMPYIRGSAAIFEWIEQAVYAQHNLDVKYIANKSINMEALTQSLPEFVHSYGTELIQLESLSHLSIGAHK